jgi:hypothetical protein
MRCRQALVVKWTVGCVTRLHTAGKLGRPSEVRARLTYLGVGA